MMSNRRLPLLVPQALILLALLSAAASAARSDWMATDNAEIRLLLTPSGDGRYLGGIDVALEPGWHTYWRNPGEVGIPPHFDFAGSQNVASVDVLYPAPERYDDGTSVSVIYRDEVVFPVVVTPSDAEAPVVLTLSAGFGVCRDICIPTSAEASVEASPEEAADPLSDARVKSAMARVPGAPEPGEFDVESVTLEGNALVVDVRMPDSTYTDLFADAPDGWYVKQPAFVSRAGGVSRYRIEVDDRPDEATGAVFHFLAAAGGEAIEESVEIP